MTTQTAAQKSAYDKAQVMLGFAEGKPIQSQLVNAIDKNSWDEPLPAHAAIPQKIGWDWERCRYRIAPTPTVRPWDFKTCPVGSIVVSKDSPYKSVISEAGAQGCLIARNYLGYTAVLENFTNLDGSPCGITEGQE